MPLDAVQISDIHLASKACLHEPAIELLQRIRERDIKTNRLIINGDLFNDLTLGRLCKGQWKVLSLIRKLSDEVETVWVVGNHDPNADIISVLMGVKAVEEYEFDSGDKRVLCLHGHQFDTFLVNHPRLTRVADAAYATMQRVDKSHRLARAAKRGSKRFLAAAKAVREGALQRALERGCDIVLCGHTHHSELVPGAIFYGNSGCFTELPCSWIGVKNGSVDLHCCPKI